MYQRQGNNIVAAGKTVATLDGGNLKFASPHYRRTHQEAILAFLAGQAPLDAGQEDECAPMLSDRECAPVRLHEPMLQEAAPPPERPLPHKHFGQYTAEWLVYDILVLPKGSFLEKWSEMSRRNTITFAGMVERARLSVHADQVLARLADYNFL